MNPFFSHTKTNSDGKKIGSKFLQVHTEGVVQKARLLSSNVNFSVRNLIELLDEITRFHDLGKYTPHFQNYLLETGTFDKILKQHAKFGAVTVFEKYQKNNQLWEALLAFYIIVHHHKSLSDFSLIKRMVEEDGDEAYTFEEQWKSIKKQGQAYLQKIKEEVNEPLLEQLIKFPKGKEFREMLKKFLSDYSKVETFFIINYLFALLIEADKLDASETKLYERKPIDKNTVDNFLANRSNNLLRTEVRKNVIKRLESLDLTTQKIFTLTAPTGVGKTFTALDVALKLRHLVPSLNKSQIIYALPFINIIEQGFEEYQKAIGEQANVLAHYQYADVFGQESKEDKGYKFDDYEPGYNQKLMELDTWQSDIVVTSFVQFFHTLIGYKNKLLKKFSHYANAIVILDEVQTLRLGQLPLLGAILYYLTRFLNTYVILMTATKPKILELAYREILEKEGEPTIDFQSLELLQEHTNIYAGYKRTRIISLIDEELKNSADAEIDFVEQYFKPNWKPNQSCLLVVNKVNRSIDLYSIIRNYLEESNLQNPIYCLSTNLTPIDRVYFIERLKLDLRFKKSPILIATQVVEAGVDLNFDMGFRDVGPIDSIVQVAGRINREANPQNPDKPHLPLYIVDFGDCQKIYGLPTYNQAKKALGTKSEYFESEYLELVESYFTGISDKSSFDESKKLFQAIKALRYDGEPKEPWYYVSDFAIIEENKNTTSVYVICDQRAIEAKEAFENMVEKKPKAKEHFEKYFKRDFHQRVIAIPKFYCEHLEVFNKKLGIDYLKIAQLDDYNPETGFIRTKTNSKYTPPEML